MAKKTFKEKEQEFLSKQKGSETTAFQSLGVTKTKSEIAYDLLLRNNFTVFLRDSIIYCECENKEAYEEYKEFLLNNFGNNGKVPFSFGAVFR